MIHFVRYLVAQSKHHPADNGNLNPSLNSLHFRHFLSSDCFVTSILTLYNRF